MPLVSRIQHLRDMLRTMQPGDVVREPLPPTQIPIANPRGAASSPGDQVDADHFWQHEPPTHLERSYEDISEELLSMQAHRMPREVGMRRLREYADRLSMECNPIVQVDPNRLSPGEDALLSPGARIRIRAAMNSETERLQLAHRNLIENARQMGMPRMQPMESFESAYSRYGYPPSRHVQIPEEEMPNDPETGPGTDHRKHAKRILGVAPAVSKETLERLAIPQEIFSSLVATIDGVDPTNQQEQSVDDNFTAIFHRDLIRDMGKDNVISDATIGYGPSRLAWAKIIKRTKEQKGPFISRYRTNFNFAQNDDQWNGLLPVIAAKLRGVDYRNYVEDLYNRHGCTASGGAWLEAVERPNILFTSVRSALRELILESLEEISKDYVRRLEKAKPGKDIQLWA